MERITEKMLKYRLDTINKMLGAPLEPYTRTEGKYKANIGNYHLYSAYGSTGVHKMVGEGGGVTTVLGLGTKREIYDQLTALMRGIEAANDRNEGVM